MKTIALALASALILIPSPADAGTRDWNPCRYEDGSSQKRCIWDARHMGNGKGNSVKIFNGGKKNAEYRIITHRRAHRLLNR